MLLRSAADRGEDPAGRGHAVDRADHRRPAGPCRAAPSAAPGPRPRPAEARATTARKSSEECSTRGWKPACSQARTTTSWQGLPGYGPIHGVLGQIGQRDLGRRRRAGGRRAAPRRTARRTAARGSAAASSAPGAPRYSTATARSACRSSTIGRLASPSASWTRTRMPGAVRASAGHRRGDDQADAGGEGGDRDLARRAPTRRRRARPRPAPAGRAPRWRASSRISPAGSQPDAPAAAARRSRWPVSCSSAASCWETAEGVRYSAAAAAVTRAVVGHRTEDAQPPRFDHAIDSPSATVSAGRSAAASGSRSCACRDERVHRAVHVVRGVGRGQLDADPGLALRDHRVRRSRSRRRRAPGAARPCGPPRPRRRS